MQSSGNTSNFQPHSRTKKIVVLALLLGTGIILFLFETLLPRPLPWLKPGLANVATILALYFYGAREAIGITICRVFIGGMIIGTLFNPAFILSFGGGVCATIAMALTKRLWDAYFSVFGISLLGAFFHNITQLALTYFLIIQKFEIFFLIPLITVSAVFTGFIVGLASYYLLKNTEKHVIPVS